MFLVPEPNINVNEELFALLADFEAFAEAGDVAPEGDVVAPLVDAGPVLSPMIGDDAMVFADPAAPVVTDADAPSGPVDAVAPATTIDDAALADLTAGFDLDALLQAGDITVDLDALILAVGRNLESFSFDLFQ